MAENRRIVRHDRQTAQGPHLPAGFVPLCLKASAGDQTLRIEVRRPVAILGRHSDVDLRFAFPEVSRRHCRFAFEQGQWRVYDLMSLNALIVNETAFSEATLYAGDVLRVGCVTLLIESATPILVDKASVAA